MRRRDFIAFVGGLASAWPAASYAQNSGAIRRVGVLMPLAAEDPQGPKREEVFRDALQQRGWYPGRNVRIDARWAAGDLGLVRKYAAELVALAPDVIVAGGGLVVPALQKATFTIPIVFTATVDPVGRGFITSLARPGGNTTGVINLDFGFSAKWLELLKQIAPSITRTAVLRTPGIGNYFTAIEDVAPSLQVQIILIDIRDAAQLERAVTAFASQPNGGLVVTAGTMATRHRDQIIALAARHRLPTVYPNRFYVEAGGLISHGPFFLDQYRLAADYVDRILRGAKPNDLPVQAPTRYETVLNLKTAEHLGLAVPRVILVRADEIIN